MSLNETQSALRKTSIDRPISLRTPLSRVRRFGSSHSGTGDFWRQRLTAVAMTLLIIPVVVVVMMLLGRNQAGAAQMLGSPPIAIILLLFIIASAWHMKIGMQVVIEDYIQNEKMKRAVIMANNFFAIAVALASIYAIFKLSSGV
jgi:succinate dehydrogenase / fumarate reductase membrane anchor subunit